MKHWFRRVLLHTLLLPLHGFAFARKLIGGHWYLMYCYQDMITVWVRTAEPVRDHGLWYRIEDEEHWL